MQVLEKYFWALIIINTFIIMKCVVIYYQLCIFFCLVWCYKNYINYKEIYQYQLADNEDCFDHYLDLSD